MKKILKEPLFYLLPLLALMYIFIIPSIDISDVKLTRNNIITDIKLPYLIEMPRHEVFSISFKTKSLKFNIIPDDCIQEIHINGNNFPLDGIKELCNIENGAYFDFSKHIQKGLNSFEVYINNNGGGHGGLRIETPHSGLKSLSFSHYIFALLLLFCASLILIKLKFRFIAISIILLGIAVRLVLYTYAGPMQYSNDMYGHLTYLQIMAEEKRIPKSNECWQCYQPPLYYIISSAIKSFADGSDSKMKNAANIYNPNSTRILQQMSLLLSSVGLILGIALMINLFGNKQGTYLASIILALWPGFILTAPKINNDILFYLGALFCMLFAQRYWRTYKNSDMIFASIGAAIALATKSNGLVILAAWTIIYIASAMRSLKIGSLRSLLVSILIVALAIGFSHHKMITHLFTEKNLNLVGNIGGMPDFLKVENKAGNYLYLDLKDYLLTPYADPYNDKGGRHYFWNYALKTSLFGEYKHWNSPTGHIFATALSVLALFIFIFALWGIIHARFKDFPPMVFGLFLFAALIYFRISYPYTSSGCFRYIYPAIFPISYFSVCGVQILESPRIRKFSYAALIAFFCLSFLFIVGMGFF